MGCNASSHAGVGVAGLYDFPDEEGDTTWSPRSVADALLQQQHQQQGNEARKSHNGGRCHHGETTCLAQREEHCGTLAPIGCPTMVAEGSSPERHPFSPGQNNHEDPVEDALTECCQQAAAPVVALNDSIASWNNSIVDDDLPAPRCRHPPHCHQPPRCRQPSTANDQHPTFSMGSCHQPSPGTNAFASCHQPMSGSTDGDDPVFSGRQWMVLPEQQYDMNSLHPLMPPYLGSMYWTAASPTPALQQRNGRRRLAGLSIGNRLRLRAGENGRNIPSLITDSPLVLRPPAESLTKIGIQEKGGITRAEKMLLSLNSTEECESEATSFSSSNGEDRDDFGEGCHKEGGAHRRQNSDDVMNQYSPKMTLDISRELLDYSNLDESSKRSHQSDVLDQSPRRLFDEDEEEEEDAMDELNPMNVSFEVVATTPSKQCSRTRSLQTILCMAPLSATIDEEEEALSTPTKMKHASSTPPPKLPPIASSRGGPLPTVPTPSSPNIATFYGHWGSTRERHVSTLPSTTAGEPIRLRVTESGLSGGHTRSISRIGHSMSSNTHNSSPSGDFFSYDPCFSTGKYTVTLSGGKPYGNGLVMRMGPQFSILEDSKGAVSAVIKSRHTQSPSTVVYAPKARFDGQVASCHRLTRQTKGTSYKKSMAVVVDGNNDSMLSEAGISEALYPWALISKEGRTMDDDCTVHMVNDEKAKKGGYGRSTTASSSIFHSNPAFCGRHGFDHELRTHTVVYRTSSATDDGSTPCCVIVRDPSNLDAVDISIAPGIDPLLMICYLASHAKMDVEPLMNGF